MASVDDRTSNSVTSSNNIQPSFDANQSESYEEKNQTQRCPQHRPQLHHEQQYSVGPSVKKNENFDYRRYYEYGDSEDGGDSTNERHDHPDIKCESTYSTQSYPHKRKDLLPNHHYRQFSKRNSIKDSRRWDGGRRSLRGGSIILGTTPKKDSSFYGYPQRHAYAHGGYPQSETLQHEEYNHIYPPKEAQDLSSSRDSVIASHSHHASDQSDTVQTFFANILVPASFIIGVSFSELFNTKYSGNNQNDFGESDIQRFLRGICVVCQGFTFALSLCVMMLSSSALVRQLTANFDPYAENGYELLFREFHFEFICVRWCFNTALFGFLLAVGCKILHEFHLFDINGDGFERWHLEIGIAVVLIMTALTLHLGAYLNSTLVGWDNMWGMTVDLVKALIHRGFSKNQPMEAASLVILGAAF